MASMSDRVRASASRCGDRTEAEERGDGHGQGHGWRERCVCGTERGTHENAVWGGGHG